MALASSSSPVGSSAIRSRGRPARAAQSAMRCCSPPDSSDGRAVGAVAQPDALEERMGASEAIAVGDASQPERHRDQLLRRQLAGERAPVVLVGVAERVGAVLRETALRERPEVDPRDRDAAGTRPLEPGDHAHQRRLSRTARAENDADLALVDVERQPLQAATPPSAPGYTQNRSRASTRLMRRSPGPEPDRGRSGRRAVSRARRALQRRAGTRARRLRRPADRTTSAAATASLQRGP